ncbi:dipeptide/oligopeptide/nickel ABC transporter ATP-binding protein, partial [Parasphingorhabdus sp.]|uniref:ABC transporter ATP-binding protein n=1 Tax=Parasphingorhabdus sp. TaxID=2709688 RepID=UPI0032982460
LFKRPGWRRGMVSVITNADLYVGAGEALAIVGGSGSGKSTLGRAIAGIGPVTSGEISWLSEQLPERRRRNQKMRALIQPVFQDPVASLDPQWTVGEIIAEPLRYLKPEILADERRQQVIRSLEDVGLSEEFLDRAPSSLSGGQAQRVAIARALAASPHMLVLDEATSALDPLAGSSILELLARLRLENRLSIIFITHDIASARRLCHRIIVLDEGRVIEAGPMEAVITNPRQEVTRSLIASS